MQVLVLAASAALIARLVVTDQYLYYVKDSLLLALIASGIVLAALAVFAFKDAWSAAGPDEDHEPDCAHDHGHDHGHGGPLAAWLLVLPLLTVLIIAPAPLGAFTAARSALAPPSALQGQDLGPLPPGDPVPLEVANFVGRANYGASGTLVDRTVEMAGFVTPNPDGSWWLTRIGVGCCAADAFGVRVLVRDGPDLPADHWVTVTGTYVTDTGTVPGEIPEMTIDSYLPGEWPINPYEY